MTKTMDINLNTGVKILREMTEEEQIAYDIGTQSYKEKLAKEQLQAAAKEAAQTKLAALGLTVEDLKALGL